MEIVEKETDENKKELLEASINSSIDNIKRNIDSLQDLLKRRDLLDVKGSGESSDFFSHYMELESFHSLLDSLFYRIGRSCHK